MNSSEFTVEKEIQKTDMNRPHVVILGAGASLAAFQNGDKSGRRLPVMKDFVEILGLENFLVQNGIQPPFDDFEGIYSGIASDPNKTGICKKIEEVVYDYFAGMTLSDCPTVYDHLVLSLREKDVIATFNWDPFLWQAAARNHKFSKPPHLVFLHGNVAIGYCTNCKIVTAKSPFCQKCGKDQSPSPLLFPVKTKNYQNDPAISAHWQFLGKVMKNAWAITFFGYGAPKTDVEAVHLLKTGWGKTEDRNLEETEIIDIRDEEELVEVWKDFLHSHHYGIHESFYDSLIAVHPRRSCEALWASNMDALFREGTKFPKDLDFPELYNWFQPRLEAEKKHKS